MIDKERQQAQTIDRLLQDRIIFIGTPIDDEAANNVLAQLLFLLDRDGGQPISIYLNSPGGSVPAAFALLDAIDDATAPIYTTCVGVASGTALLVLAHGTRGCRFALPHARFQMTALSVGSSSRADGEAMRVELQRLEELIISRLAQDTGQPQEKVRLDMKGELFLDAYRARQYGLIDEIVKV